MKILLVATENNSCPILTSPNECEKLVPKNWYAIACVKKMFGARKKTFAQKSGGQPGRVSVRVRTGPALHQVTDIRAKSPNKHTHKRKREWMGTMECLWS